MSELLKVDDKVVKKIVEELYYPKSPYEFSVIGSEILGTAYERFLGKVIRLTKGHRVKIEEKPEVRKAGGVYYTPQYIVDYIIESTVGKVIQGKSPDAIARIRVCDPACGSGSFLLGAYQYLLDYHLSWYIKKEAQNASRRTKDKNKILLKELTHDGQLTTEVKKNILINNIFGVDIDSQAVEVTRLSLLMKCMEGETSASVQTSLTFDRVLPSLDNNIKAGNSLVDFDYYDGVLDFGDDRKVRPFNWELAFPEIFKHGKFDVIVGNPPYVFGRDWKALGIDDYQKKYLGNKYQSSPYQLDMFSIFMEKADKLCKRGGRVGYIVPNVWLTNTYSSTTRNFILSNSCELVLTVPPKNVFEGITVDTIIYTLKSSNESGEEFHIKKIADDNIIDIVTNQTDGFLDGQEPISTSLNEVSRKLLNKLQLGKLALSELADITRGIHPYRTGGYGKSAFAEGHQTIKDREERPYNSAIYKEGYRPFIYGKNLKRFTTPHANEYIKYGKWLAEPRSSKFFEGDRIYSRKILSKRLRITIEKGNTVADQQVYITKPKTEKYSVEFLAAILGSKLMSYFIRNYFDENDDDFPQIKVGQLKSLPIQLPDLDKSREQALYEAINEKTKLMVGLNDKALFSEKKLEVNQLLDRVNYLENLIDKLVYDLYDLSEEEITVIESAIV